MAGMNAFQKIFSKEEASRALVLVRPIVRDVLAVKDVYLEAQKFADEEHVEISQKSSEQISHYIHELEQIGCFLKDFRIGLVDFPSEKNGKPIYLCWKYGEDTILYWHEVSNGYQGRRSLENLPMNR